ncbi:MAG: 4Fe-4S binding protein [Gammaproteobacteria bacterium]|nr:4Fe-4S binding protein [Gammaproteobacteria bacterium]
MTLDAQAWPASSEDGQARRAALQASNHPAAATTLLEYRSAGHLLIVGDAATAQEARRTLSDEITSYVLIPRPGIAGGAATPERSMVGNVREISGHLGAFGVTVDGPDGALELAPLLRGSGEQTFDLLLDLQRTPHLQHDILPAGYYAPRGDAHRLQDALEELQELVGEFEKPKYFDYDANLCAHGRNGKYACRRCIDACPTVAISSAGERIEVDPYLCQGGGSCATACPSGAITYAYPSASDMLGHMRGLLGRYFEAGGSNPSVLFYDREHGAILLENATAALPENVLAVAVEEIGSLGMDSWLATLAFGAADITLLAAPGTAPSVAAELQRQLSYCHALLQGLEIEGDRIGLLLADSADALPPAFATARRETVCRSPFETFNEKRNTVFAAIERLARASTPTTDNITLPRGAPFGEVQVNAQGCTLCLACASACPAGALQGGSETPLLRFIEAKCVQCGLCAITCPEQVMSLAPRMLLDPDTRREPRTLHEEQPFNCLDCGKAFATQKIIDTMQLKLKDHWMFGDEAAMRRLKLCDECRIKDMLRVEGGLSEIDKN